MNDMEPLAGAEFSIQEVTGLINFPVVKIERGENFLPENIGLVVGVLTLNEQVEIVVKFIDRICQLTKSEFFSHYRVLRDDYDVK